MAELFGCWALANYETSLRLEICSSGRFQYSGFGKSAVGAFSRPACALGPDSNLLHRPDASPVNGEMRVGGVVAAGVDPATPAVRGRHCSQGVGTADDEAGLFTGEECQTGWQ